MEKIPTGYHDRRREGDTVLRQCQLTQLHLLYVLDEVCRRHDLKYWLAWGSCLGAVRHKGFLPWDDDLDIALLEADFKKLMEILPSELPEDMILQTPETNPRLSVAFPKVRDVNSFYAEVRPDITMDEPSGIYVDIFNFVAIPKVSRWITTKLIHFTGVTWHRQRYFLNLAGKGLLKALWCVPTALVCCVLNKVLHSVRWILLKLFGSDYVCDTFNHGAPHYFHKSWFEKVVRIPFEDGEFPVPVGYEKFLDERYGDWHEIPPPDKRPRHTRIIDPFHSVQ